MLSLATLLAALQAEADQNPNRVIIATEQSHITVADFVQRVALLSAQIKQYSEHRWLVWLPEFSDFVVALFALWHAGKTPVVPPNFQPNLLLELSDAYEAVLVTQEIQVVGAHTKPQWVMGDWTAATIASQSAQNSFAPLEAESQLVLYTSGSTDQPKPITKYLTQLDAEVQVLEQLWGTVCADKSVLGTVPHHHIYGLLFRILWPLAAQRVMVAAVAATPTELSRAWQDHGACVLISSPTHLTRLPALVDLPTWSGRYVVAFSSGAPFPESAAREILGAWALPVQEVYGSSETGGIAWRQVGATLNEKETYPCWNPLPGVEVRYGVQYGVQYGAAETLEIISPFLPDKMPYTTADRVEIEANGSFKLCGRVDRVVKIEGKRASLDQIEGLLRKHPWVAEVVVLALSEPRQCLAAVVVLRDEGEMALAQGRAYLSQQLRQHLLPSIDAVLVPRRWRFVEQLPVDARGKLPLKNLLALFSEHSDEKRGEKRGEKRVENNITS